MVSAVSDIYIKKLRSFDIRFPTSLNQDGSDALHTDPDYSCAYVILDTSDDNLKGHGFTFTIGRGTEVVVSAINALAFLVEKHSLKSIASNFGAFWHKMACESQLRWLGPEKGVIHLATGAIINALWDLWAKVECKPLWKLLADMEPEELVKCVDFQYIRDSVNEAQALDLLRKNQEKKNEREEEIINDGLPAYITSAGWLGYSNEKIKELCTKALSTGWTRFKMKVGNSIEDDKRRASLIRSMIGNDKTLVMDANQRWDVDQAVDYMIQLAEYKPLWIEEPTSPDDVLGHKVIAERLKPYNIAVATGEHCQNRTMFKQFLSSGAMQFCQIDACRVGGVNEIIAILLLAQRYKVPVCPHAGGVGLCELVPHLAAFNYLCISPSFQDVVVEFADHLHEHFTEPARVTNCRYHIPQSPGYAEMKSSSIEAYTYPNGSAWQDMFSKGIYPRPKEN